MIKRVSLLFLLTVLFFVPSMAAGNSKAQEKTAINLIKRVLPPNFWSDFRVEIIPSSQGNDVFEVESVKKKIVLRGNNPVSIASALNHYIRFAGGDISWNCGNQLNLPVPLPETRLIRVVTPNKIRFAYNFCTHGYTMAWWSWEQWEKELDYLSMQGINMALVIQGVEQVWINTLKGYGYSEKEVRDWLVMPTHIPWMLMSNFESYNGIPESISKGRLKLGLQIVKRMHELGMSPVLPGYYGMVPPDLQTKKPEAKIHKQGLWCGMKRPDMLEPTDPLFTELAGKYYAEQQKLFGTVSYYAADPFHEGGSTKGIDVVKCGQSIHQSMLNCNPNSTWVMMSWSGTPIQAMIDGLDKSKLLVVDLYNDRWDNWVKRKAFNNTPWIWGVISNFGGNNGLDGVLTHFKNGFNQAANSPAKGPLCGIAAVPEGSELTPAIWSLFFENSWNSDAVDINKWTKAYIQRRYGVASPKAGEAWDKLLTLVYGHFGKDQQPFNTTLHCRPSLSNRPQAREWAGTAIPYDPSLLIPAWKDLLAAAPECGKSEGYNYDLTDLTRQVLADAGTVCNTRLIEAFKSGNKAKVKEYSELILQLLDEMEAITATRREFLLGNWIRDARRWGSNPQEADNCEYHARLLVTIWTEPASDKGSLRDYSNRSWSGLIKDFYRPRWEIWLTAMNKSLENGTPFDEKAVREEIRKMEFEWVKKTSPTYPTQPQGNTVEVSDRIYKNLAGKLTAFYK